MPTYEYECDACGHEFEKFQSITAPATRKCPECKKLKVRRKIGAGAGVIFKGSGFYQTDYRSDSYKKAAQADSSKGTSGSDSSSSKTSESASSTKTGSDASKAAGKANSAKSTSKS